MLHCICNQGRLSTTQLSIRRSYPYDIRRRQSWTGAANRGWQSASLGIHANVVVLSYPALKRSRGLKNTMQDNDQKYCILLALSFPIALFLSELVLYFTTPWASTERSPRIKKKKRQNTWQILDIISVDKDNSLSYIIRVRGKQWKTLKNTKKRSKTT